MLMNSHANHHWAFTWANPRWNAHRHCHARAHACAHVSSVCGGGCVRVARPPRTTGVSQHQQPPSEKACARDVHKKSGLDAKATPLAQPRPGTMQAHHVVGILCEPLRGAPARRAIDLLQFFPPPPLPSLSPFPPLLPCTRGAKYRNKTSSLGELRALGELRGVGCRGAGGGASGPVPVAQVVVVETKLLRHFCTGFVSNTAGTPVFVVGKDGVGG